MTIMTADNHSRTSGLPPAAYEQRGGHQASTLVYRIESHLRSVTRPAVGRDGVILVEETDARVTGGRFAGGRYRGLERVTLRVDGPAVVEGREGIDIGDAHVAVDIRGSVQTPSWSRLPSPGIVAALGYDFPDEDLRMTGTALFRTIAPRYAHLDGAIGRIEGWVNLASGELEVEAWSDAATA
jgi:hypothetical protein